MNERIPIVDAGADTSAATVGIVEVVSSNSIEVAIIREAPRGVGLREGTFQQPPRINSFLVIPSGPSSLLAVVVWVGIDIDRQPSQHRSPDQIGLPIPARRLRAVPVGSLTYSAPSVSALEHAVQLERGAIQFPIVGDPVRLPTSAEERAALPRNTDGDVMIRIGHAAHMGDAEVAVSPDRLFGRHLAVLGSTGSGKSCSVAHILRECARSVPKISGFNAIVLDLSGEYRRVFDGLPQSVSVRHFAVEPTQPGISQLRVPYWLWNTREWFSFGQASTGVQAPRLRRAIRDLRSNDPQQTDDSEGGRTDVSLISADLPIPFNEYRLLSQLEQESEQGEGGGHLRTLVERLRVRMTDRRMASVCGECNGEDLEQWLRTYMPDSPANQITVIDLSLMPSEVLNIVVAVLGRVFIESMQRHHHLSKGNVRPRILVVEEAHTLMRRDDASSSGDSEESPTQLCRRAFERIAREGRKFGLSLVVSSQRPSELSETVSSQCNTLLIHRIANERDQALVRRLTPDSFGALVEELPGLPTQTALLVGWALEIPAIVRMCDVDYEFQPMSADPGFADTWSGKVAPTWSCADVAKDWLGDKVDPREVVHSRDESEPSF